MDQIKYLHILDTFNRGINNPADHTFIPVQMCFDVHFEFRKKSQLVAGGYIKGYRDKDGYCGVINIHTMREDLFF